MVQTALHAVCSPHFRSMFALFVRDYITITHNRIPMRDTACACNINPLTFIRYTQRRSKKNPALGPKGKEMYVCAAGRCVRYSSAPKPPKHNFANMWYVVCVWTHKTHKFKNIPFSSRANYRAPQHHMTKAVKTELPVTLFDWFHFPAWQNALTMLPVRWESVSNSVKGTRLTRDAVFKLSMCTVVPCVYVLLPRKKNPNTQHLWIFFLPLNRRKEEETAAYTRLLLCWMALVGARLSWADRLYWSVAAKWLLSEEPTARSKMGASSLGVQGFTLFLFLDSTLSRLRWRYLLTSDKLLQRYKEEA